MQIGLAWTANPGNATAVEVYRKGGGADWTLVGVLAQNSTGDIDRSVRPGTSYSYRVRAANDYFASGWSSEVSAATLP